MAEPQEHRGGLDLYSARFPFRMVGISLLLLIVLLVILFNPFGVRRSHGVSPAYEQIREISMAAEGYLMALGVTPPPTGIVDLETGQVTPFAAGEEAVADAIHRYLGKAFVDPRTGKTMGPFLRIRPDQVRVINGRIIVVDPWGNPLRFDVVDDPNYLTLFRVWSMGADGKEGPVPLSRVKERTDPRDKDNYTSWH